MKGSPREIIQFLVRSDNRVTVLGCFTTGASLTRSELQTETGIARSIVSQILRELEAQELVSSDGHRYEVTPLGRFLAGRLHPVFDSVEAIQRLQTLLKQLSDTDADIPFIDHTRSEILTPTSSDPGAPARRFADLLQVASHVRLLVPATIPLLFNVDPPIGNGTRTVEIVIPHTALPVKRDALMSPGKLRDATASGDVTLLTYDGDIAHLAGTIDKIAVVGLTDDAGTIQGYIETSDETVRSWTEAVVEAYQQNADRVLI